MTGSGCPRETRGVGLSGVMYLCTVQPVFKSSLIQVVFLLGPSQRTALSGPVKLPRHYQVLSKSPV